MAGVVPHNGLGAQLRGPPQALAEAPRIDASEATTLATARRGHASCSALLGGERAG